MNSKEELASSERAALLKEIFHGNKKNICTLEKLNFESNSEKTVGN